jgi:hypothetical protein
MTESQANKPESITRRVSWEAIIGILAIIVPVIVFFIWQWQRKELSYIVSGTSRLLTIQKPDFSIGKLEILLDGKAVEGLISYNLEVVNTGNIPITADEMAYPIKISFGEIGDIVIAEVIETNDAILQADLRAGITIDNTNPTSVQLPPVLLNSGDYFKLNIVVSQAEIVSPKVEARIVGIERIIPNEERWQVLLSNLLVGNAFSIISIVVFLIFGLVVRKILIADLRRMQAATAELTKRTNELRAKTNEIRSKLDKDTR